MNQDESSLRRISVWSGWLRVAHGLFAGSVLLLIATGWLVKNTPSVANASSDLHLLGSTLLLVGLALRFWLFFREKTTGSWKALWPDPLPLQGMVDMLKFYASFGRMPLPHWHAHNPLWIPLYALMILLLLVMATSGMAMGKFPVLFNLIYLPDIHRAAAYWLTLLVVLHVLSSILHDFKGTGSDISGIVNGHRIFQWQQTTAGKPSGFPEVNTAQTWKPAGEDKDSPPDA